MRWILALVVLAAALGGAWLLLGEHRSDESAIDEAGAHGEDAKHQGPSLTGSGGSGSRAVVASQGRCAIECRVTKDGQPAIAVVEARRAGGPEVLEPWRGSSVSWVQALFAPPALAAQAAATASSDATGNVTLAGLAPGVYRVTARGPDGTQARAQTQLAVDGARGRALLELLPSGLVLEARVTWSDGKPAEGTLLLTRRTESPVFYGYPLASDDALRTPLGADGTAKVEGLSAGTYDVRALVGETVVSGPPATLPAKGSYVLTLEVPGQRVNGRVLDAATEAPVAGATVLAQISLDERARMLFARTTADADGRFTLALPRPTGNLSVEAPGYATLNRALAGVADEVVVRLVRSARVAGRVTSADGKPAAGAVVVASNETAGRGWPVRTTATADREGRFSLDGLVPGNAQIVVRGGGWVSPGLADATANGFNPFIQKIPAAGAVTLDLTAVRAAKIEGKVVDAGGAAVPGAAVTARPGGGRGMYYGRSDPTDQDTASSDQAGAFVLENLTPDLAYNLAATAPDQPAGKAGPFSVASESTAQVEIRFPAARYVDVVVLYEGEETPVVGAKVVLNDAGNTQSATATTDASGRAHAGPAGEGVLNVTIYGTMVALRNQGFPVEGSAEGPGPFTTTVHVPRGLTVEGRVLKADGTPAVGAQVELDSRARGYGYQAIDVTTAADGSFVLGSVAPGPQAVRATWRAGAGARLTGRTTTTGGATDATITLGADDAKGLETFKFHVLDEQGAPVASASVRLAHENGSAGSTVSDGWATLQTSVAPDSSLGRALAKGTAFVEVSDARGADGMLLPAGPGRVGPLSPEQREIEVRLPGEQTIEGRVVAGEGGRVAGILVNARGAAKGNPTRNYTNSQARTDAQGQFRIGALGEGDYVLTVAAAPEYVPVPAATVPAGTTGHVVRLKRGVTARIQVADPGGRPVSGANVFADVLKTPRIDAVGRGVPMAPPPPVEVATAEYSVADGFGGRGSTGGGYATNQDGVVVLRGLDGEVAYTLRVNVPSGRDDVRAFRQEGWNPADTDLRLAKGFVVAGAVRDASGKPVEGSRLERKIGESWQHAGIGNDGTFRITGLEPGPVSLRAFGPGRRREAPPTEVTVQAGDEHVVLVVDPGLTLTVRVPNLAERAGMRRNDLQATLMQWLEDKWTFADRGWDRQGNGSIVFLGLKPEVRYAVWIPPAGDEFYGWAADVRPGEVSVRLERGGSIRGRVTGPAGVSPVRGVSANNEMGMDVTAQVDANGAYEVKGLPDGRWHLGTWAQGDGKTYQASGEAQTGGTLDLALQLQEGAPGASPAPMPVGVPR